MQLDGPERHRSRDMLQRNTARTRGDGFAVALEKLFAGRIQQGQPATVDPGQVSGQLFGIATSGIDSSIG
jgi:hypothetical protein